MLTGLNYNTHHEYRRIIIGTQLATISTKLHIQKRIISKLSFIEFVVGYFHLVVS